MLVACPLCACVAVQCTEKGGFFTDPRSLRPADQCSLCPRCREHALAEFLTATDDQLRSSGLTAEDYS